jgi:hypothetical protein
MPAPTPPYPPIIILLAQASGQVVVSLKQNPVTGSFPVASFTLYRGPASNGPWTPIVENQPISPTAVYNNLLDPSPVYGVQMYYVAVATDTDGLVSALSSVWPFTAYQVSPTGTTSRFAPNVFGAYPILGADVFINPTTRQAVIGPNGDLLCCFGLECLAQDLRIRLLTHYGELPMHQTFGFGTELIGSGQTDPVTQAQILRTRVYDMLKREPRVKQIIDVLVEQNAPDGWSISYTIVPIGQEDPAHLNAVVPFQ